MGPLSFNQNAQPQGLEGLFQGSGQRSPAALCGTARLDMHKYYHE